jgi:hypothetical protein
MHAIPSLLHLSHPPASFEQANLRVPVLCEHDQKKVSEISLRREEGISSGKLTAFIAGAMLGRVDGLGISR